MQKSLFKKAIAAYDKALARDPKNVKALNNKGRALARLYKYRQAISMYNKSLKIKPDFGPAYYNKGHELMDLRRYGEAQNAYIRASKYLADFPGVWYHLVIVAQAQHDLTGSELAFERLRQIEPHPDHDSWMDKEYELYDSSTHSGPIREHFEDDMVTACSFMWNGKYQKAFNLYDQILSQLPDYEEAWYRKGMTLFFMEKYDKALAAFNKALELEPNHSEALNYKGLTLIKLKIQ